MSELQLDRTRATEHTQNEQITNTYDQEKGHSACDDVQIRVFLGSVMLLVLLLWLLFSFQLQHNSVAQETQGTITSRNAYEHVDTTISPFLTSVQTAVGAPGERGDAAEVDVLDVVTHVLAAADEQGEPGHRSFR